MAHSRFEYVKHFEIEDRLLPFCWLVVRVDGKGFTKFTTEHNFQKPNDDRALHLMNQCAQDIFEIVYDVVLAYGESDEYSKIATTIASQFSACYVYHWNRFFPDQPLLRAPCFDGRVVAYPSEQTVRDYFAWRQADTHVNNQYNVCFWELVKSGLSGEDAHKMLKGTQTAEKTRLLSERFSVRYSELPSIHRYGSVVVKQTVVQQVPRKGGDGTGRRVKTPIVVLHTDIIRDPFWEEHPHILACGARPAAMPRPPTVTMPAYDPVSPSARNVAHGVDSGRAGKKNMHAAVRILGLCVVLLLLVLALVQRAHVAALWSDIMHTPQ